MNTEKERSIEMTKEFQHDIDKVFEAWTKREHVEKWWGPKGFTVTTKSFEFVEGGQWVFIMHGPDGTDYDNIMTYTKIERPERIEYEHGNRGAPGFFTVKVEFSKKNGNTQLHFSMLFNSREERDEVAEKYGAAKGLEETLGRLESFLK